MFSTVVLLAATMMRAPCDEGSTVVAEPLVGYPVVRRFERRYVDDARRLRWEAYCRRLDELWAAYRGAGSTPIAFDEYRHAAAEAKRRYVEGDPYLILIEP